MKNKLIKLVLIASLSATVATPAFAFFDSPLSSPSTGKLIEPDHEYEIDTWGSNSEIYEFTPRSHTGYSCVMLMLDNSQAMGLQCFPKPDYHKNKSEQPKK